MRRLAFLAVLALAGCGGDSEEASAPQPVTVTQTITETQPPPATTGPEQTCSVSELHVVLSDQALPPAVAEVRQRIFDAALACDYDALEEIAEEKGEGFTFSYGGGTDASEHWRSVEEAASEEPLPLRALAMILTMPYARNESGSYAWPTAYTEMPTAEAWEALVDAGLYSQEQVELMQTQNTGYLGYRTAITADGDWQFFVAGD